MLNAGIFRAIADLGVSAKARDTEAHGQFLSFYRDLVTNLPTEGVKLFGSMPAGVRVDGSNAEWRIELTVTDYIWWKQNIEQKGARFQRGPVTVQLDMLNRLSKQAEAQSLSPEDRRALLALLEQAA